MTQTNAARFAALDRDMHYLREQLARGAQKFDRIEQSIDDNNALQNKALAEILDRSRTRDNEIKDMRTEQAQATKALHDKIDGVEQRVATMQPHVATIAKAKAGVAFTWKVGGVVGGGIAGAIGLYLMIWNNWDALTAWLR